MTIGVIRLRGRIETLSVELSPTYDLPVNPWPVLAGALIALLCLWGSMATRRKRRLLSDLPTSKAHGVFIGFVEVDGTAQAARPLTSVLARVPCVAFAWTGEEKWSRTVHYTDSKGKSRTRRESGWTRVAGSEGLIPFSLQDDTGAVLIQPEGARLEMEGVFDTEVGPDDPLYYLHGPREAVSNSDHIRRFSEEAIQVGTRLFVVGQAREREDVVAAEIAHDPDAPLFLITVRSERQVGRGLAWQAFGWDFVSLLAAVGGVFLGYKAMGDTIPPAPLVGAAGAWLFVWSLSWSITAFNSLVNLRQRVRQAWSLVDVQLKRRNDLIPNLVQAVQGFRDHESRVQAELATMRSQLAATPPGKPGPDPHAVLGVACAVAERFPELKAQESFLALQRELADTEQRIALARAYFNDIATFHNTRLETVPDRWVAALAGLRPRALMTADEFERAAPVVNLVGPQTASR